MPWSLRFCSRFASSHSYCIYELYIHPALHATEPAYVTVDRLPTTRYARVSMSESIPGKRALSGWAPSLVESAAAAGFPTVTGTILGHLENDIA